MRERRRFVRIPESSSISYRIMPNIKTGDYLTKDISQGGIRFFVHNFIPRGSLLKIRLNLKNISFSFEAMVRAVWIIEEPRSERYEVGVEFINISDEATKHLINYIKDILGIK